MEERMKEEYEYDGKKWNIETDVTSAVVSTSFVRDGVARTELVQKEGSPNEIEGFLKGKRHKVLYAWNVKVLTREALNKGGYVKYRETATVQAEGIRGDGRKFKASSAELGDKGTPLIDTKLEKARRMAKKYGYKTYILIAAIIVLLIGIVAEIVKLVRK